jgi:hypothetical protein
LAGAARGSSRASRCVRGAGMNDDDPDGEIDELKAEHRRLDEQLQALIVAGTGDQLEIARLKKRKLHLKDRIQQLLDLRTPDIIA